MRRKPYEFPRIEICETDENREKIDNYHIEDIKLINYKNHNSIVMKMVA